MFLGLGFDISYRDPHLRGDYFLHVSRNYPNFVHGGSVVQTPVFYDIGDRFGMVNAFQRIFRHDETVKLAL
jgi:hypothetical protein